MRGHGLRLAAIATVMLCSAISSNAAELRKVAINFGLNYPPVGNGPQFSVPKAMGFWAEEGLDVEVQFANGVGSAVQQLIAGSVVATFGGLPPSLSMITKGANIQVAASLSARNTYYPVVLETSSIRTVADMKGKNIGVTSASSSNVFFIRAMLLKYGLNPDKDVNLVSVGSGPAALNALTSGKIDVLQLFESAYDQVERDGFKLRRFDDVEGFKELNFTYGVTVRKDTLKNDPDLIVKILRGVTKGVVYAKAHPQEAVRIHWKVYPLAKLQGVSDEVAMTNDLAILASSLKNAAWVDQKKYGYAELTSVSAMRDAMKQFGDIDKILPVETYYDQSLIAKINDFDHDAVRKLPPPKF